ncbi:2-hydroxy-6-oxohepta-2,4-dienoate hydrolase [Malaciobacter molluscorum LMG 25693]|uniref:2-hydroxy-6-oxohepta-2,4-dienoate hydrolase n=1 Tax=Malaciobacter molluscorum LMG 25693 TaxID=870501 RepID=A0A2G1DIF9_9BACT|nr:alpha/beta hydrolase [Malaciobacter molluscorum]AXX91821.1 alpha/beta hydrolase family protein [Malaciobacter molluscorum LMG 25693]PHO18230.1 2-hydroxy-6-oxohepta-2,4-dienoate hydrolase [Malaciobacter molluscorum LMG 25693]
MAVKNIAIFEKDFDISYEIVNPTAKKDIVFLHGWGSNKSIMKNAFSNTLKNFRHIYIDMPGFGKTSNEYVLQTTDYVIIIDKFLQAIDSVPTAIAGHSYGGKVATLLKPQNLILLSTAGILEEKSLKVKLKIFFAKILNMLGLRNITKTFRSKDVESMNENMYETFKNVVNEDFTIYFKEFKNNALIFWGEEDTATSLQSGKKISQLIEKSTFKSYKGDHYFFCKNAEDIAKCIEDGIL